MTWSDCSDDPVAKTNCDAVRVSITALPFTSSLIRGHSSPQLSMYILSFVLLSSVNYGFDEPFNTLTQARLLLRVPPLCLQGMSRARAEPFSQSVTCNDVTVREVLSEHGDHANFDSSTPLGPFSRTTSA